MALPARLLSARMTNATIGDQIDNHVSALEVALCDILGIPIDIDIAARLFTAVAAGLHKIHFQDLAGDPAAIGELARNTATLKFHNGLHVGSVPLIIDKNSTPITVTNTLTQTQLYKKALGASLLGTTGRLRFTAVGQLTILPVNVVALQFNWAGVGTVFAHAIVGGNTTTRTTPWKWVIEIYMNGATNSWRALGHLTIATFEGSSGVDHVGVSINNGPTSEVVANLSGAVDLAADREFQITAQWSQASGTNSLQYFHSFMELLP